MRHKSDAGCTAAVQRRRCCKKKKSRDEKKKGSSFLSFLFIYGAGEESRTLDLYLGKVSLYQLSYSRMECVWRRGSGSNRRRRLCRPLHNHFATPPGDTCNCCQLRPFYQPASKENFEVFSADANSHNEKRKLLRLPLVFWSGRRVSNSRPIPWQGIALPTELLPHQQQNAIIGSP